MLDNKGLDPFFITPWLSSDVTCCFIRPQSVNSICQPAPPVFVFCCCVFKWGTFLLFLIQPPPPRARSSVEALLAAFHPRQHGPSASKPFPHLSLSLRLPPVSRFSPYRDDIMEVLWSASACSRSKWPEGLAPAGAYVSQCWVMLDIWNMDLALRSQHLTSGLFCLHQLT